MHPPSFEATSRGPRLHKSGAWGGGVMQREMDRCRATDPSSGQVDSIPFFFRSSPVHPGNALGVGKG